MTSSTMKKTLEAAKVHREAIKNFVRKHGYIVNDYDVPPLNIGTEMDALAWAKSELEKYNEH